jgi:hypothetical protein
MDSSINLIVAEEILSHPGDGGNGVEHRREGISAVKPAFGVITPTDDPRTRDLF